MTWHVRTIHLSVDIIRQLFWCVFITTCLWDGSFLIVFFCACLRIGMANILFCQMYLRSKLIIMMSATISASNWSSLSLYLQLFVGWFMFYLRYFCLLENSGVQHILYCFFCFVCLVSCVLFLVYTMDCPMDKQTKKLIVFSWHSNKIVINLLELNIEV